MLLQDRVRTETYRAAIMQHKSFIEGKVILSFFPTFFFCSFVFFLWGMTCSFFHSHTIGEFCICLKTATWLRAHVWLEF